MIELRPYQSEAIEAAYAALRHRDDNPCIVLPTGTGKSLVAAQLVTDIVQKWGGSCIVAVNVKELVEQNYEEIKRLSPGIDVGIYSAGLGQRDTKNAAVVAGIQSTYKRAWEFDRRDILIVDEAHMIPPDGEGMYRQFIADAMSINPKLRIIGLTATDYRMKGGRICKPENMLNYVCYEAHIKDMIEAGYLSPVRSPATRTHIDSASLPTSGGEFKNAEMAAAFSGSIVSAACAEIVEYSRGREFTLLFTANQDRCEEVAETIQKLSGCECPMITDKTPKSERDELIRRARGETVRSGLYEERGPLKYLANVDILTTGFNAPRLDCIALLRATQSPGLYVQMIGRGTRRSPGKADCLILDYGENIVRHGPIDAVVVREPKKGTKVENAGKECQACHEIVSAGFRTCPHCGEEFPVPEEIAAPHGRHADGTPIMSGETVADDVMVVGYIDAKPWKKRGWSEGDPVTVRIDYFPAELTEQPFAEWVCPEHSGYARRKFESWWKQRSKAPVPSTADETVRLIKSGAIATTEEISIKTVAGNDFPKISKYTLGDVPDWCDEPGAYDDDDDYDSDYSASLCGDGYVDMDETEIPF